MLGGWLSVMSGCAFFGSRLAYLPSEEEPLFLDAGTVVPWDAVCLQPGTYQRLFRQQLDHVVHSSP
jgi:hypothetical protein